MSRSEWLQVLLLLRGGTRRAPVVHQHAIETSETGEIFDGCDDVHGGGWQILLLQDQNAGETSDKRRSKACAS
jgi:hypothetical protein